MRRVIPLFISALFLFSILFPVFYTPLPNSSRPFILYTNQERKDLKQTLVHAFSRAKDSIAIGVYSLTDRKIISLLNQQAQFGLSISIWVDRKQVRSLKKKLDPKIELMTRPQSGLMHQKLFLIDDLLFIGSSNLTTTSLRMHDNCMIGLYLPPFKAQLLHYLKTGKKPEMQKDSSTEVFFLPSPSALERILSLITQAKKTIDVAQFTFTHPLIAEALVKAHDRGVRVRVLFDALSTQGASKKVAHLLCDAGLPTFQNSGVQLMHHKMAWIDHETFIIGSTNWTKSAFERNQDDLFIFSSLKKQEKREINTLWRHLFWDAKRFTLQ